MSKIGFPKATGRENALHGQLIGAPLCRATRTPPSTRAEDHPSSCLLTESTALRALRLRGVQRSKCRQRLRSMAVQARRSPRPAARGRGMRRMHVESIAAGIPPPGARSPERAGRRMVGRLDGQKLHLLRHGRMMALHILAVTAHRQHHHQDGQGDNQRGTDVSIMRTF